ncbi:MULTISPECIES: class I SAM-dependent methyltransferase [Geobacter]|uniref:class I SAM-dependent methyltransferase n=1 Tax=Geobacter TaxID=28231 RepID=UPI0020B72890|nr:class I SAM-dependent methyltransferase [Geobacter sulfurreducens]UTG91312.1 class I SAM-dependent methyltransferase [Geobacter sulfurreducens]BEH10155.1 class I SAM-dependent methyltransferase [Geobacter sulfurreducens subsp. ethanolicus]BET58259.1 class I SAM-dependent methyltransferase [Geobacter sp. 60473]HML78128.1 class I SAM-dependent methyltransferase [Geobacter sulfurreducens]
MSDKVDYCVDYYTNTRMDIVELLPRVFNRVLEIGCGSGNTLKLLRSVQPKAKLYGIEISEEMGVIARASADEILVGDIEHVVLGDDYSKFDLILCLDVIEHLINPWALLVKARERLDDSGCLIASIPNVRNYKIIGKLLFGGDWKYNNAGILDRGHLRFFTKKTMLEAFEDAGYEVVTIKMKDLYSGGVSYYLNKITLGLFEELFAVQYLLKVRKKL